MSDVIERLAASVAFRVCGACCTEGSEDAPCPECTADTDWWVWTEQEDRIEELKHLLAVLHLTPSQAAMLADGTGVVVPREPTKEMALAGESAVENAVESTQDSTSSYIMEEPMKWAIVGYRAMLAAAQPKEGE